MNFIFGETVVTGRPFEQNRVGPKGYEVRFRLITFDRQFVRRSYMIGKVGNKSHNQSHSSSVHKCPGSRPYRRLSNQQSQQVDSQCDGENV